MPENIVLQMNQYKVEFDVPDGSKIQRKEGEECKVHITLPGNRSSIIFSEIRASYSKEDEIKNFTSNFNKKRDDLDRNFPENPSLEHKTMSGGIYGKPEPLVLNGYEALHLKRKENGNTEEEYLIWLADNAVCDMYFFNYGGIELINIRLNL